MGEGDGGGGEETGGDGREAGSKGVYSRSYLPINAAYI